MSWTWTSFKGRKLSYFNLLLFLFFLPFLAFCVFCTFPIILIFIMYDAIANDGRWFQKGNDFFINYFFPYLYTWNGTGLTADPKAALITPSSMYTLAGGKKFKSRH